MIQSVQMELMVRSVYTTVHRTVRILPVTSLQKMGLVLMKSANRGSKEIIAQRVCFILYNVKFNAAMQNLINLLNINLSSYVLGY